MSRHARLQVEELERRELSSVTYHNFVPPASESFNKSLKKIVDITFDDIKKNKALYKTKANIKRFVIGINPLFNKSSINRKLSILKSLKEVNRFIKTLGTNKSLDAYLVIWAARIEKSWSIADNRARDPSLILADKMANIIYIGNIHVKGRDSRIRIY